MAYRETTTMDINEIKRRKQHGEKISSIAKSLGFDRKTIRKYLKVIEANPEAEPTVIKKELNAELKGRPSDKQDLLEPFKEEIKTMITEGSNRLKPKSAFEVISIKHNLSGQISYSSFKRFIKNNSLNNSSKKTTCRIEAEPGSQIQIDYCKVGLMIEPDSQKRKTVYAFIGTLAYSRHKYVEFVFSQNQKSFVQSHINMFNYFGGTAVTIKLDNLKSGVIKPDLYDPKINRAYAEMAEHYGLFLDPCRVAKPKDKGIVERDVQTVREEFRKLLSINPLLTISEANIAIKNWAINIYGQRKHGTTNQCPYFLFKEIEQPVLLSLPEDEYEISEWKTAIVHPDHYIQVNKKAYSIPDCFVGKEVMVKIKSNLVSVYYKEQLVKQHTIPKGFRQTDINDFPDHMRHRLDTGMPFHLRKQAAQISLQFDPDLSGQKCSHQMLI